MLSTLLALSLSVADPLGFPPVVAMTEPGKDAKGK